MMTSSSSDDEDDRFRRPAIWSISVIVPHLGKLLAPVFQLEPWVIYFFPRSCCGPRETLRGRCDVYNFALQEQTHSPRVCKQKSEGHPGENSAPLEKWTAQQNEKRIRCQVFSSYSTREIINVKEKRRTQRIVRLPGSGLRPSGAGSCREVLIQPVGRREMCG